jgi:hypothetical protein
VRWVEAHEGGRNSLGFREREIVSKAPGILRIAEPNGCLTFGQGIFREKSCTALVDGLRGPVFEMFDSSRQDANYDRHEVFMEKAIDEATPDDLLYQWYSNDLQPADERRPVAPTLAGPMHCYGHPRSALYSVATHGFFQLRSRLGPVPSHADYFEFFRDRWGDRASPAR